LSYVFDPEIPINIVDLGLVYNVNVDKKTQQVHVTMTLTSPTCGMGPTLIGDVHYLVKKVPHVKDVTVELIFDPPWSRDKMTEEAQLETGLF
jgi:metal-sulfur cluster biosynthetic enzyme